MEAQEEQASGLVACRFCLEETVEEGDEFLAPCRCAGSMKYIHRSCLDQWRTDGYDPKTVTHCGTCKVRFRMEQREDSSLGAEGEVWLQIMRYLAWRFGLFLLIVSFLGFLPRMVLGSEQTQLCTNAVLNHFTLGTASTFALTGGYALCQVLWWINPLDLRFDRWGNLGGGKDGLFSVIIILIIVGACVLLYYLIKGVWEIATVGGQVAAASVGHANRKMRSQVVQRYKVLNFDPHEPPVRCYPAKVEEARDGREDPVWREADEVGFGESAF